MSVARVALLLLVLCACDASTPATTPDAGVPAASCSPAPATEFELLHRGTLAASDGVVWSWSHHHYVGRDEQAVQSEIVWPWILPGRGGAIVGDDTHAWRLSVGVDGTTVVRLSDTPMRPWVGTVDRGALFGPDGALHLLTSGSLSTPITVPVEPALPTEADDDVAPPLAAFTDESLVWCATDDTLRETDLRNGTTRTLASGARARALGGSGRTVAWLTEDLLVVEDLATSARRELAVAGAEPPSLIVTSTAVVVGQGDALFVVPLDGSAATTTPVAGGVHALATDGCNLFVGTTTGRVLRRAAP